MSSVFQLVPGEKYDIGIASLPGFAYGTFKTEAQQVDENRAPFRWQPLKQHRLDKHSARLTPSKSLVNCKVNVKQQQSFKKGSLTPRFSGESEKNGHEEK